MQKDFKIGLIIGLFIVVCSFIWLAALPSSSIIDRLRNIQRAQAGAASKTESNNKASNAAKSGGGSQPPTPVIIEEKPPAQSADLPNLRFHIVLKDQTLSDIARLYYGSPSKWTKIRDANPTVNPDKLAPGIRLYIPP